MEIKGAVHVHSTYSQGGKESLESLRAFLLKQGVTFCCVTEHAEGLTTKQAQLFVQECKQLSGSQFVFIPGFEVAYLPAHARKKAHVLLIGTEVFFEQEVDAALLATWSPKAALAILAHPARNGFQLDQALEEAIDAVEIWNTQFDGAWVPRTQSVRFLRRLQQKSERILAAGGLSLYSKEQFKAPLYTLEVAHVTSDAIIRALQDGAYVFGREGVAVSSTGLWKGKDSVIDMHLSALSLAIIAAKKSTSWLLALFAKGREGSTPVAADEPNKPI